MFDSVERTKRGKGGTPKKSPKKKSSSPKSKKDGAVSKEKVLFMWVSASDLWCLP